MTLSQLAFPKGKQPKFPMRKSQTGLDHKYTKHEQLQFKEAKEVTLPGSPGTFFEDPPPPLFLKIDDMSMKDLLVASVLYKKLFI